MYVFGGEINTPTKTIVNELFSLDLKTLKWKKLLLPLDPEIFPKAYMASTFFFEKQ